mgnify:CR=1 FL=1
MGSPPLARGTGDLSAYHPIDNGITPACAGNSLDKKESRMGIRDHPRLRGEQSRAPVIHSARGGSPPLARGTGGFCPLLYRGFRITPACAGNSAFRPGD